jgi:exopolysaccharide production protein ExoQ
MRFPAATRQVPHSAWASLCATALAIGAAYWMIGHSFDYSARHAVEGHLHANRIENQFAAQQGETTQRSALGFFLLGGVGLACWMTATKPANWRHGLLWLAVAYLAWCGLSLLWSIDPAQSVRKLAITGLVFVGAVGVARKFELEDQLWIAVLVLGGLASLGLIADIANGTFKPWRADYRFSGTCHPNEQGVQCALLALATGYAGWAERHRVWLGRTVFIAALAGLWFSRSRTALVALLAAALVGMLLHSRGMQRWLGACAALGLASIVVLTASFGSIGTLQELTDVAAMGRRQDLGSLTGRMPLWQKLSLAADDRPWAGHGYGAFWGERNVLRYSKIFQWHIPHAHNAYLDLVLESGLIGLALYLTWVLAAGATAVIRQERSGRAGERFVVGLIVFALVHGFAESKLPGPGFAGFLLVTVLVSLALHRPAARRAPAAIRPLAATMRGYLPATRFTS